MKGYRLTKSDISKVLSIASLLFLFLVPIHLGVYGIYLFNLLFIYVIISTGLNILTGYAGQISFGQAGFVAIGAYTSSLLIADFNTPFLISIVIGGLFSSIIGFLLGFPILRLKEIYLAMVTLAWSMILQLLVIHMDKLTNGWDGLSLPSLTIGSVDFNQDQSIYYVIFTFTLALLFLARNIVSSRLGRVLASIKDSEIATSSLGINVSYYKSVAFAISAFYAGIGGGLYAVCLKFIGPDDFGLMQSIDYLLIIVIGGMGYLSGPIYGSIIIIILGELFRAFATFQELSYGILLLFCLLFLPGGISLIMNKAMSFIKQKSGFFDG